MSNRIYGDVGILGLVPIMVRMIVATLLLSASASANADSTPIESRVKIGPYADNGSQITQDEYDGILNGEMRRSNNERIYNGRRNSFLAGHYEDLMPFIDAAKAKKAGCGPLVVSNELQSIVADCKKGASLNGGDLKAPQCESRLRRQVAQECSKFKTARWLEARPLDEPQLVCTWDYYITATWQYIRERAGQNSYYLPKISQAGYFGMDYYAESACVSSLQEYVNTAVKETNELVASRIREQEAVRTSYESDMEQAFAQLVADPAKRVLWTDNKVPRIDSQNWSRERLNFEIANRSLEKLAARSEVVTVKDEFETQAEFEKRRATALQQHAESAKQTFGRDRVKIVSDLLSGVLGNPKLSRMNYDADRQQFSINVTSAVRVVDIDAPFKVPREEAPATKSKFSSSKVWVVHELSGDSLVLAGLVLEADKTFAVVPLRPRLPTGIEISQNYVNEYRKVEAAKREQDARIQAEMSASQGRAKAQQQKEISEAFPDWPRLVGSSICQPLGVMLLNARKASPNMRPSMEAMANKAIQQYMERGIDCLQ